MNQQRRVSRFIAISRPIGNGRDVLAVDGGPCGISWALASLNEHQKLRIDRDSPQESDIKIIRHDFPSAAHEDVGAFAAVRAHEPTHVLDHAKDVDAGFGAKIQLFPNISRCNSLRRCYDHSASKLVWTRLLQKRLCQGDVLVTRPWWCVHQKVVELVPENVRQKLPYHGCLLRSPPNDGVASPRQEEPEAHDPKRANTRRLVSFVDSDGQPPARGLCHFRIFYPKHARHGGAREVDIENTNRVASQRKRQRQLCRYRGFTDASFAGKDLS